MTKARRAVRVVTAIAAAVTGVTCADLFTAAGVGQVTLVLAGDSVIPVGAGTRLSVTVTVGGQVQTAPRLAYASSDSTIVAVRGDSLVGKRRGLATVTVSLASSVLPSDAPRLEQRVRVVIDTLVADSASVTFASLGDTVTLAAFAFDANRDLITPVPLRWSSTDSTVVGVDSLTGRIRARANGTATIRAVVDVDTARVGVTVQQELDHYTFNPGVLTAPALALTLNPVAVPRDKRGAAIALPGVAPTWSIDDATIGLINAVTGATTSLLNGSTWLRATNGNVSDSLRYIVDQAAVLVVINPSPVPPITSLGETRQLTVRAFDANSVELQSVAAAWFTLDPALLTVTPSGVVTALATGTGRVLATLDGALDTAVVLIGNVPASVQVLPDTAIATSVGDTIVFRATVRNGIGDSIAAEPVTWRSTDTTVARVLPDGRTVTLRTGAARIIAQSIAPADTGVAIIRNDVDELQILPAARSLTALGAVDTPAVQIENARDAPLGRSTVAWSSDDVTIARVNAVGVVSAVDTGQTFIRAVSGALQDSVLYTVTNDPVSVTILGRVVDTLTALGHQLSYSVDIRNTLNAPILNYPVTWTSTDTNQVRVDTAGGVATATVVGFGTGVGLIAQAGAQADTAFIVPTNLSRLLVDNSVVVVGPRVGTGSRPYARIQNAMNDAEADDTVFVRRGTGLYREGVSFNKRIILLGDSTAFLSLRDPATLPMISHDTGSAAIFALTTAPVTIRYLAVRHTADGPALLADGSDVTLEYFYVNPPGSVTGRIGRGISLRNSPSASGIRRSVIRNVRGYGVRLENVFGAVVGGDSVVGVDSLAFIEPGAAIRVIGGGNITISSNLLREAQGPLVSAVASAALIISSNAFYGRQTQVLLDSMSTTAVSFLNFNTFDLNVVTGNDNLSSASDGRAGLLIRNTRGTTVLPVSITNNTFTAAISPVGFTGGSMDGIRMVDSRLISPSVNTFKGLRFAIRTNNLTGSNIFRAVADSVTSLLSSEGLDSLFLQSDTVRVAANACVNSPSIVNVGGVNVNHDDPSSITIITSRFENCARAGTVASIIVQSPNGDPDLSILRSTILTKLNSAAVIFEGGDFSSDSSQFVASTIPGDTASFPASTFFSAVHVTRATSAQVQRSVISDFHRRQGLRLVGTDFIRFGGNRITRNGRGFTYVGDGFGSPTTFFFTCSTCPAGRRANDVYDNDTLGFATQGFTATFADSIWWGDGRGPRSGLTAPTGDSMFVGPETITHSDAPLDTGGAAVGLRIVRGNNFTRTAGTAMPIPFTVRVVDANGKPVSGVSVRFMVAGGGGTFAGPTLVDVVSNISGLAEATLTLGPSPGVNTVNVSGTTVPLGTVTFTTTGT